jgi:hypothetical protein
LQKISLGIRLHMFCTVQAQDLDRWLESEQGSQSSNQVRYQAESMPLGELHR